jgi:hypothetical protein
MDIRSQIVEEAKSWVGTPFVHEACVKGVGVDCCTILSSVYSRFTGDTIELPHYDIQWNEHVSDQPYLEALLRYCVEVSAFDNEDTVPEPMSRNPKFRGFPLEWWDRKPPLPADIGLWFFGRCWAHCTIVVDWPVVVNPMMSSKVSLEHAQLIGNAAHATRMGRCRIMRPKFLL